MAPLIESEKKEHDDDPLAQDKNSTVTELKSRVRDRVLSKLRKSFKKKQCPFSILPTELSIM